jgi:hypothetical protein
MANKDVAYRLLDYITVILDYYISNDGRFSEEEKKALLELLKEDIRFHDVSKTFYAQNGQQTYWFNNEPDKIEQTNIYQAIDDITNFTTPSLIDEFLIYLHLQLLKICINIKFKMTMSILLLIE